MLRFANATGGNIRASQDRLARMCGVDERTIRRTLDQLKALGIFEAVANIGGGRAPVVYQYHAECVPINPDVGARFTEYQRRKSEAKNPDAHGGNPDVHVQQSGRERPTNSYNSMNSLNSAPKKVWTPEEIEAVKAEERKLGYVETGYKVPAQAPPVTE